MPIKNTKRLVLFDRDDTLINDAGQSNLTEDLRFFPTALPAINILVELGYEIGIATNQSSVGRGLSNVAKLSEFHESLDRIIYEYTGSHLSIVAICPHVSESRCNCRKPKPGLLAEIAIYMEKTPMVLFGNSDSDLKAAESFGIPGIQVNDENLLSSVSEWVGLT
jgi:D-glycero-D-manno-heptose 1,7-bisphosphate phosphatase